MGTSAYQGSSNITILAENLPGMINHLEQVDGGKFKGADFEDTLANFGIDAISDKDGNIVNIFLNTSSWSSDVEEWFFIEIAKFVEPGSFLTLFIEGAMVAFVYRNGTVEEIDLGELAKQQAMQEIISCASCKSQFAEGKIAYHWPDPKVMECISPGDTVPLGLCPNCSQPVYQNEKE